jgi:hypothetical protein
VRPSGPDWMATCAEVELRIAHPLRDLDQPALPIPFTLSQWNAFCKSAPLFADEAIDAPYTNDDGSIDEIAVDALAAKSGPAAELVRAALRKEICAPPAGVESTSEASGPLESGGLTPAQQREASDARHRENRIARQQCVDEYRLTASLYSSKDAAAHALSDKHHRSFDTVRGWLKGQKPAGQQGSALKTPAEPKEAPSDS